MAERSRPNRRASERTRNVGRAVGGRARAGIAWLRARPRLLMGSALTLLALFSFAVGLFIGAWRVVCRDCPSIAQIYVWEPMQATKILDRNGQLIAELFRERRTPVRIEELPPYVPQAFVAVEDKRFFEHNGFDFRRLITANLRNLLSGRITGGGSTITQQLARNMFTEEIGYEQVISRKLKEAKVARELEQVYPKERILEAYINQVNYSDRAWYGIETAAQHYFGKPAVRINPAEAALLAAVINRPTTFSPFRNPELARSRRNLVLDLMADQGYLTDEDAEQWKQAPIPTEPQQYGHADVAPYFVEWVRGMLDDRFGADLYSKGLRVITTLDLEMQAAAQAAMDSGWAAIERAPGYRAPTYAEAMESKDRDGNQSSYIQGMFIAMSPQTGEVRALIGGRDFRASQFNRATQAIRQAGSTFKPFVYAAAIESGIPASHVIYDAPLMLEQPDGSVYSPRNYDPEFRGPLTLRDALKHSVNTVAVQLGLEVGLGTVVRTAQRLGISTEVPPYPSTSIGAASVIPLEMAESYSAFATEGTLAHARPIQRVEDADGRVLWQTNPDTEQVLDPMVAAIVRDMLRTVVDNGTGYNVRSPAYGNLPYEVPAAGKTGTTNDATNVWFVGFTPNLLAAAWFGFDMPQRIVPRATGGTYAAPVVGGFFRSVYYADSATIDIPEPWTWPEGITTREIDRQTGKLAAFWCSEDTYQEYFIPGTEPTDTCEPRGGLFGQPLRRLPGDTIDADSLRPRRRRF